MRPNSSSGNRPVVATFAAVTLGSNVGDKISTSMDIRFISGVDDSDDNTNLSFRLGLYNSNGTAITADGQRFDLESGTGNDFGYFARIPIGDPSFAGNTDARLSKETGVASGTSEDPLFGQDNSSGTGGDVSELGQTSSFPPYDRRLRATLHSLQPGAYGWRRVDLDSSGWGNCIHG